MPSFTTLGVITANDSTVLTMAFDRAQIGRQISVHPLSGRSAGMQKRVPYTSPLQYRLDDNVVRVFPKGTGRGYL